MTKSEGGLKPPRLTSMLEERVPDWLLARIREVSDLARQHSERVFLVGGFVRDLLLRRDSRDLDLVVEGDGLAFAARLAEHWEVRAHEHRPFLTASLLLAEGLRVDVATARTEIYPAPAALPEVEPAGLREDLKRRDFTVNTLAIRLDRPEAPKLIDFFGGVQDLKDRLLRVLHPRSFEDDPTRILRGVRLEAQLAFSFEDQTAEWLEQAVARGVFQRLSGSRLREELLLLLSEPELAADMVARLGELGVLQEIHPRLVWNLSSQRRLDRAVRARAWLLERGSDSPTMKIWRMLLMAIVWELDEDALSGLAERLHLGAADARVVVGFRGRIERAIREVTPPGVAPHEVAHALSALEADEIALLLANLRSEPRERVGQDVLRAAQLELGISGADLLAQGFSPGPAIGRALEVTRAARLDGTIRSRDELSFALKTLRELTGASG